MAAIANRLNIGIDTLVFVDDQPFERAEVATAHPSMRVVDALELERFLDSPFFDVPVTAESQARRAMYRQEIERSVRWKAANGDYLEFLRGCGMHLTIATLAPDTVARVYELAQRTNQMNFSGNRYSLGAIEAMLTDETIDAYVLRASDRFGDYGIIGFCVVEKQGPLMRDLMFSCRIQSKYVDRACLAYLIQTYAEAGHPRFEAIYNETPKNRPAAEVFWDFGFEKTASDGDHHRLVFDSTAKGTSVAGCRHGHCRGPSPMKLSQRIEQRLASHVPVKPFHMRGTQGVISFTFDDVPRTALTVGGQILNRYGAGGTYYVSGSLTGQKEEGLDCHVLEDIKAAVRDGHEVGSHGYSHVRYSELTDSEIDEDLERNTRFLGDALGRGAPHQLLYPFGASRLRTKRRLASNFVTARGIRNGINRRMCDLSDLRAHPIFSNR